MFTNFPAFQAREDKKGGAMTNLVDAALAVNEPKKQLDKALLELEKTKEGATRII